MGRRKKEDNLTKEISIINQADSNLKRQKKRGRKRKRVEITENEQYKSYEQKKGKDKNLYIVEEELDAVRLTNYGEDDSRENRKLTQFIFHDDEYKPIPVEMLEVKHVYVSGFILPLDEDLENGKELKVQCTGFGPLESWAISEFETGKPIIWISTEIADYECLKPASSYKKFHNYFYDKACACTLMYRKLSKSCNGNPNLQLEDLVSQVASSLSGKFSDAVSIDDLIESWGEFIHNQLVGLDETSSEDDTVFTNLPVLLALKEKCKKDHIEVEEPSEDTKLERLMDEIDNWQYFQKGSMEKSITSSQTLYIKSNKQAIEKDYPSPGYYKAENKETEEIVIFGSPSNKKEEIVIVGSPSNTETDISTKKKKETVELPRRKLDSWSLYNLESSFVSLEFLTMSGCGDNDYTVYGSGILSAENDSEKYGTPLSLTAIKEWSVEFKYPGISILIRTNMAWYILGKPSQQYAPWFEPVMKSGNMAASIISWLKEQRRASRLTFEEIVKKVSDFEKDHLVYISSDREVVERFMVVHGNLILQIFSKFPDDAIRKCLFVRTLQNRMKELPRTKKPKKKKMIREKEVIMTSKKLEKPSVSRKKQISATTTKFIESIWKRGVSDSKENPDQEMEGKNIKEEVEVNENEDKKIQPGDLQKKDIVKGDLVKVGDEEPCMYLVEYLFANSEAKKMIHGRQVLAGSQTILGNFSNKKEVFLTHTCKDFELANVIETLNFRILHHQNLDGNSQFGFYNSENQPSLDYFCKNMYLPEKGGFFCLQFDIGSDECYTCKLQGEIETTKKFRVHTRVNGFTYEGLDYKIQDFLYLDTYQLTEGIKRGRYVRHKPYIVCQLLELEVSGNKKEAEPESVKIKVRRFFRPEDISAEKAYRSDIRELYYSKEVMTVPVFSVRGKCDVRRHLDLQSANHPYVFEHIFFCNFQYDPKNGTLKKLPPRIKLSASKEKAPSRKKKRRVNESEQETEKVAEKSLAALDLFAGCGGLSEGLKQAGVSFTKWAIEFDDPSGKAFELNHPNTSTFITSCNVILRAIMSACGNADECVSTSVTNEAAAKLDSKVIEGLPRPGQVDFIYGGPPCQGFSNMNRFSQSPWSLTQSTLILNFVSYVDVFRPKFVLLENVRNFTSFNNGQMFRFTLASLIEMGYQVRFGVLEAGAYGISQSRKRAFIWAASPGQTLPEWPEPMHVFNGPQLRVNLDNNIQYAAVKSTATGAPFRAITVRDTIGDLPEVLNGASENTTEYNSQPISWFQKRVRGEMKLLNDHISKEMSELNLTRCKGVPKCAGADWRKLPIKRIKLSNGRTADLVPLCVRQTAPRHNQWKGVYGRVDWEGHFPTTVTDPHPMHKVGMCFHPEQDRILTVREYARSQGFPDSYKFVGTVMHKHKQIGNAVPPPLAFALGRKLKESLDEKCKKK